MTPILSTEQANAIGSQLHFCEVVQLMGERRDHLRNYHRAYDLMQSARKPERLRFAEIAADYSFKAQMLTETIRVALSRYETKN